MVTLYKNGKVCRRFETEESLLDFLKHTNLSRNVNTVIANLRVNDSDCKLRRIVVGSSIKLEYSQREYVIKNENGRFIDPKEMQEKLNNFITKQKSNPTKYMTFTNAKRWRDSEKSLPEFRREPIPYTGNRRRGHWYIRIRTTNERRYTNNSEQAPYNRSKRAFNIPTFWDEKPRHCEKSWKSQCKNKKQWGSKAGR